MADTLWAAFVKAQSEFPTIAKDATATVKGKTKDGRAYEYDYSYADLPSILGHVRPVLNKHGIAVTSRFIEGRLVTAITHTSGEGLESVMECSDAGLNPQDYGKKITYYRRYAIVALLGLAPDDDDDAQGVPPAAPVPPPAVRKAKAAPPATPAPSSEPTAFEATVRDLYDAGVGALIGRVDDPKGDMKVRMERFNQGHGVSKAREVADPEAQQAYVVDLSEMVEAIRKGMQS